MKKIIKKDKFKEDLKKLSDLGVKDLPTKNEIEYYEKILEERVIQLSPSFFDLVVKSTLLNLTEFGGLPPTVYGLSVTGNIVSVQMPQFPSPDPVTKGIQVVEMAISLANKTIDLIAVAFASESWMVKIDTKGKTDNEIDKMMENCPRPSQSKDRIEMVTICALNCMNQVAAYNTAILRDESGNFVKVDDNKAEVGRIDWTDRKKLTETKDALIFEPNLLIGIMVEYNNAVRAQLLKLASEEKNDNKK